MVKQRQPTRSRPETAVRRREILDAAVEIFGAKGSNGATLQEIADRVGMTHAGILHHFGSKEQLLLEVVAHRDEADVADLPSQHMPEGAALFGHLIDTAILNTRRAGIVQAYAVLSAESVTEGHPGRSYFERRYEILRADLAEAFVVMCRERGVTEPDTIADASAAILGAMDGLQVQWLLDPTAVDLGRTTRFAIEAIVAAVVGEK